MVSSHIEATIRCDVAAVWDAVTAVGRYSWRSDLSRTEILNETQFVEYTLKGYATTFTITAAEPYKRWELAIENRSMKGRWVGIFTPKGQETHIDFTETVMLKAPQKFFFRPFIQPYLKKQQARFVSDLKKALQP